MQGISPLMMIVVALLVVGLVAWLVARQRRSTQLRSRFGPEYDHVVSERGRRGDAEAELARREKRVERFHVRTLPGDVRARFLEMWKNQQARFVDEPKVAVTEADHLVEEVMKERGYPVTEFDQRAADLSVDHPHVIENYRAAHEIAERHERGQASTEDLRRAMIYYRDLFRDLLEEPAPAGVPNR